MQKAMTINKLRKLTSKLIEFKVTTEETQMTFNLAPWGYNQKSRTKEEQ
jgi:hypothetical protein